MTTCTINGMVVTVPADRMRHEDILRLAGIEPPGAVIIHEFEGMRRIATKSLEPGMHGTVAGMTIDAIKTYDRTLSSAVDFSGNVERRKKVVLKEESEPQNTGFGVLDDPANRRRFVDILNDREDIDGAAAVMNVSRGLVAKARNRYRAFDDAVYEIMYAAWLLRKENPAKDYGRKIHKPMRMYDEMKARDTGNAPTGYGFRNRERAFGSQEDMAEFVAFMVDNGTSIEQACGRLRVSPAIIYELRAVDKGFDEAVYQAQMLYRDNLRSQGKRVGQAPTRRYRGK